MGNRQMGLFLVHSGRNYQILFHSVFSPLPLSHIIHLQKNPHYSFYLPYKAKGSENEELIL